MSKAKAGDKQALLPKLRFPEFRGAGDWRGVQLAEIGDTVGGLTGKSKGHFGTGAPFVTYMQVFGCAFVDFSECGKVQVGDGERQNQLKQGDILFTTSSETPDEAGFASVVLTTPDEPTYLNSFCFALRPIQQIAIEPDFSRYLFRSPSYRKSVSRIAQGSTRFNLSKAAFLQLAVPIPQVVSEQQKIADCLSSLDALIAAHTDKLTALKTYKKGLLQQLFPRDGETVPRLRFPEFCDAPALQRMPLGKVAEIKLGKMLDANKHKSGRLLPYVNNISLRWNDVDTSDLPQMHFKESELERYGLRDGDVLVCEGGEPGRSAVWDGRLPDLKFQKAIHRVRFNVPFVPEILVLYLKAIAGTTAFDKLFTGGGIKHLTRETFAKLALPVASFREQQCIADCLSSLDTLITAQSDKIAALKQHKQGLLQQLFPVMDEVAA